MKGLLDAAIAIGPRVLVLGVLVAAVCSAIQLFTPSRRRTASPVRYLLTILAVGAATFVAGAALGIAVFCSAASSGNLCGLGGVLGLGPLFSGIGTGGYAYVALKRSRNPT